VSSGQASLEQRWPKPAVPDAVAVEGGGALVGRLRPPPDKSLSHRALIVAALAEGRSTLVGLSEGDDVRRSAAAVAAIGATVEVAREERGLVAVVEGGAGRLVAPRAAIDAGNSGTTLRLMAGVLASHPWRSELVGDASLSARPMDRVAIPLAKMGARVLGRGPKVLPPLVVEGAALRGIDYRMPVASAQVKSAILLAGLRAAGETVVREPVPTRPHTEELLALAGCRVERTVADGETVVALGPQELRPFEVAVPRDPSQAAFVAVGACTMPDSAVVLEGCYAGRSRLGFLTVLERMGARVRLGAWQVCSGLPVADIEVASRPLDGTVVDAAELTGLDEVPVLAVAAAAARGRTVFRQVAELRVKESDRLEATVRLCRAFGAEARAEGDDLVVEGRGRLEPGSFDAKGDHRMAMAAVIAGLAARPRGRSTVVGFGGVATSWPGFVDDLRSLGARIQVLEGATSSAAARPRGSPGASAPAAPGPERRARPR
jgi:3-phosphoshikimate 1-carboxyvinyltransferase